MSSARNLEHEGKAVEYLREQVRREVGLEFEEDQDFFRDVIEGETNFFEALNATAAQIISDDGLLAGIDLVVKSLMARAKRIEHRSDKLREAVRFAMEQVDLKSYQAPAGTFTRSLTPQKVVVIDEGSIPAEYWVRPPAQIDKKALKDALKAGKTVNGAELSNRSETLSFRKG